MMKSSFLLLSLLIVGSHAFAASGPMLSTGHREAMLANGGSTDTCSSGQFALNPAGIFCGDKHDRSESFGSANFSATSVSIEQGGISEMGQGLRAAPGLSIFSQGVYEKNWSYGFWASINPDASARSFLLNNDQYSGAIEWSVSQTETSLGPFISVQNENSNWGAVLSISQTEINMRQLTKVVGAGQTALTSGSISATEQAIGARVGGIWGKSDLRYSATLTTPSYSVRGVTRSDRTSISTDNTFSETLTKGTIRTSDSGYANFGAQFRSSEVQKWGAELTIAGERSVHTEEINVSSKDPASFAIGFNSQRVFTEKISFLSGLRFGQSLKTSSAEKLFQAGIVSFGILRKYKGVELGSGFGFTRIATKYLATAEQPQTSSTTADRFDITFSSSFTY